MSRSYSRQSSEASRFNNILYRNVCQTVVAGAVSLHRSSYNFIRSCKMSKVTKIVVIIFMIELKCECDTLTGKKQGLILNESDVKESVNQIVNLDYIKYRRQGLWRCYNLMMWKKRKRISGVYNKLKRIISSRIKRSQYFFGNSHSLYENTTSAEEDDSVVTVSTFKKLWPIDDWYRFGLFTDGFISYIDSHWLQFPPPKPSLHYTLAVLYIMLALIGLLGNSIVLLMYYRSVFFIYSTRCVLYECVKVSHQT